MTPPSIDVSALWGKISTALKPRIGEIAFEAWLKPVRPRYDATSNTLFIEVPSDFFRDWITQHYELAICDLLKGLGETCKVDYAIDSSLAPAPTAVIAPAAAITPMAAMAPRAASDPPAARAGRPDDGFFLNPKYTFESFVVGPSNRFTHAACLSIAESPAKAYNPLFIYGKVGLGKTHLMQAICQRIRQSNPRTRFFYTTSEKFMNDLISAIQHRSTAAFRDRFRNVDVLLIDDIHFIAGKESTQEEFFHTFNALYDAHKQIIISSDRPPKEIQKLEERLVSRFSWGLVTDIQPPDYETRVAILQKKVEAESVVIPQDAIHFIAEMVKTNIRELEGALVRVIAYALLEEKPVTLDLVKVVLRDLVKEAAKNTSLDDIIRIVADHYKVSVADIKTKKRVKTIVIPRQVAMYLTRELTQLSLPEIGQGFGGKDHTTVLHAVKKIKLQIQTDANLRSILEKLQWDLQR